MTLAAFSLTAMGVSKASSAARPPVESQKMMADSTTTNNVTKQSQPSTTTTGNNCGEEVHIDLTDPQVGEAAKKIQNAFRFKRSDKKTSPISEKAAENSLTQVPKDQ